MRFQRLIEWDKPQLPDCPVGWGCKIHRLLLCWRVRPSLKDCPGYDTKQWRGSSYAGALGNAACHFIAITLRSLWPREVAPDRVPSMVWIELNGVLMLNWIVWYGTVFWHCVFMLNWTVWNKTVLTLKLIVNKKIILILNWIVWNRTVSMYKNGYDLNNLQWLICY